MLMSRVQDPVNVMTATLAPVPASLTTGMSVSVLPNLANTTTTPTLNVNGLGAKTITKLGTTALAAGDYTTTAIAVFIYDGTHWQLQNPQTSAGGSGNTTSTSLVSGNFPAWQWRKLNHRQHLGEPYSGEWRNLHGDSGDDGKNVLRNGGKYARVIFRELLLRRDELEV